MMEQYKPDLPDCPAYCGENFDLLDGNGKLIIERYESVRNGRCCLEEQARSLREISQFLAYKIVSVKRFPVNMESMFDFLCDSIGSGDEMVISAGLHCISNFFFFFHEKEGIDELICQDFIQKVFSFVFWDSSEIISSTFHVLANIMEICYRKKLKVEKLWNNDRFSAIVSSFEESWSPIVLFFGKFASYFHYYDCFVNMISFCGEIFSQLDCKRLNMDSIVLITRIIELFCIITLNEKDLYFSIIDTNVLYVAISSIEPHHNDLCSSVLVFLINAFDNIHHTYVKVLYEEIDLDQLFSVYKNSDQYIVELCIHVFTRLILLFGCSSCFPVLRLVYDSSICAFFGSQFSRKKSLAYFLFAYFENLQYDEQEELINDQFVLMLKDSIECQFSRVLQTIYIVFLHNISNESKNEFSFMINDCIDKEDPMYKKYSPVLL